MMASLQSISKQIGGFDDVITREPIKNDDTNATGYTAAPPSTTTPTTTTTTYLPNGKIQTKDRPCGVDLGSPRMGKEKSHGKDASPLAAKTRKKLMAFKKRSMDVIQEVDYGNDDIAVNTLSGGSELGEYNFKRRVSHFVNMAFENSELETSDLKFSDVVRKVINDPIKEDIHPFGRGHLYASAFDGAGPKMHHDEAKYLIWLLASLFIIGIAGSVILMSITYTPEVDTLDPPSPTFIAMLNTTA